LPVFYDQKTPVILQFFLMQIIVNYGANYKPFAHFLQL